MNRQPKPATLRFYKESILRVLVHVQQHLDEPLPLEDLARLAGLSRHHFHHVFTGMMGEPLAGHVRRLRLERAAQRLQQTSAPVIEVALDAAYENHESFTRAFRAAFGVAPAQFRRHQGGNADIAAPSGVHYREQAMPKSFRTMPVKGKPMNVIVKHLEPMRVAYMRHIGPYDQVGPTWDRLMMLLGKDGLLGGDTQCLGLCHDDPTVTPAETIRYDACVTVDQEYRPAGEIGVQTIPGGDFAVLTHFGPYDKLGESYSKLLGQWLPRSGRQQRADPCFEIYLNAPDSSAPEDLITDIYAPLQPQ